MTLCGYCAERIMQSSSPFARKGEPCCALPWANYGIGDWQGGWNVKRLTGMVALKCIEDDGRQFKRLSKRANPARDPASG